jgi:hypothetical protein
VRRAAKAHDEDAQQAVVHPAHAYIDGSRRIDHLS